MKCLCYATMKNGDLCLSTSTDGTGKCGRHGGLSRKSLETIKEMKTMGYEPDGDVIMTFNN